MKNEIEQVANPHLRPAPRVSTVDVASESAESQAGQLWRSTKPWPLRVFWRVADAEPVDRYIILPLAAVLRKTVAGFRRLTVQRWIGGVFLALKALLFTTDVKRWHNVAREVPAWDGRNKSIAKLIQGNSTVLDLGAGAQTLGKYLEPGCEYQPCDVVKSSDNVLLCDFNRDIYPAVEKIYDYVVCSGVLEYIRRPGEFLRVVSCFGKKMLVSFAPVQEGDSKLSRLSEGWVNHLTRPQLEALFDTLGLVWSVVDRWQDQIVYRVWREPGEMTS